MPRAIAVGTGSRSAEDQSRRCGIQDVELASARHLSGIVSKVTSAEQFMLRLTLASNLYRPLSS
ncbi:protein of unknown function [Pararobbsia alpina]